MKTTHTRKAVLAKTVKKRAYHLARARGDTPAEASRIAKDLDEAVVMAHRKLVEIEKETLVGSLRGDINKHKKVRIREKTGLATSTISNLANGVTKRPTLNTIQSLGVFLDIEIRAVPKRRGTAQVIPMRPGGKVSR